MKVLHFIWVAVLRGTAYIDCDGTILERFKVPLQIAYNGDPDSSLPALEWWMKHLRPTPIIRSRLVLLYVLRLLGVRLILWTNRYERHRYITKIALGLHGQFLFSEMRFYNGLKSYGKIPAPVMDDRLEHVLQGIKGSLLVETL